MSLNPVEKYERILDIVKLSKVEACFLFVKIALFSSRYSG